ncbi:MAG: cofactor-independent phosphoglycerate mutase [Candidatus Sumerlaeia bacterium]|nr:cofactor-independent phosphoglycerate mutase [Candidatus Sumerlaeia bacterium]
MKAIVFLGDGMADEPPLPGHGDTTPLRVARTPNMDRIAREGRCGTFRSLPEGYPTSSDIANMSVLGLDITRHPGRGPLEAAAMGLTLAPDQIALRCNLVTVRGGILEDYSGGHISSEEGRALIDALNERFGSDRVRFHPGVQYRHIIVLTGDEFAPDIAYEKPDDHQGDPVAPNLVSAKTPAGEAAATLLREMTIESQALLDAHPVNRKRVAEGHAPANMIWPWSAGRRPDIGNFEAKYGCKGAVVSAVDVIFGIGFAAGMEMVRVPGATGWIDTNYEGKADAAVKALERADFVYLHVEAIDELSHLGDAELKIKTIEEFDRRLVGRVMSQLEGKGVTFAVIPDHPVPVQLRKHTRTPVPFAVWRPGQMPDSVQTYDEAACLKGSFGLLEGDGFMRAVLG